LAITASRIVGHKIELYECIDGKSFQIIEHTAGGQVVWPLHIITIREAGLALELLITVAPSIIKTGIMGFTLPMTPTNIQEQYKKDVNEMFDKYIQLLTQNELYWCMRSMDDVVKRQPDHHAYNHVRATIKGRMFVYEKKNSWWPRAEENIRHFICAYKDLAMAYMTVAKQFPR
jgi:hypothetical protein